MLPPELFILERALKGCRLYTFSGDQKLCRELESIDSLLDQIRHADSLTEVQTAVEGLLSRQTPRDQVSLSL
jgi:hypothetical protein